jgi:hypothetical protein
VWRSNASNALATAATAGAASLCVDVAGDSSNALIDLAYVVRRDADLGRAAAAARRRTVRRFNSHRALTRVESGIASREMAWRPIERRRSTCVHRRGQAVESGPEESSAAVGDVARSWSSRKRSASGVVSTGGRSFTVASVFGRSSDQVGDRSPTLSTIPLWPPATPHARHGAMMARFVSGFTTSTLHDVAGRERLAARECLIDRFFFPWRLGRRNPELSFLNVPKGVRFVSADASNCSGRVARRRRVECARLDPLSRD